MTPARRENTRTKPWPVLGPSAYQGLAGDIARTLEPYTEPAPVAHLVSVIVGFGNLVGDEPHFRVPPHRHPLRLFVVFVGDTSAGAKGSAWAYPKYLLGKVDRRWMKNRIMSGLASGEGLIFGVRDTKRDKGVVIDPGVKDKRLLVVEPELAAPMQVAARPGSTFLSVVRDSWEAEVLRQLSKNNPLRATRPHISIIANTTTTDLHSHFHGDYRTNGFANRFGWFAVRDSKDIPSPVPVPPVKLKPLIKRLREAAAFSRTVGEIKRSRKADALWEKVYPALKHCKGVHPALRPILARARPQVMRIACIYALLDCSRIVRLKHLRAALCLWEYSQASVQQIFANKLGDSTADRILAEIKAKGPLSETSIQGLFGRHKSRRELQRALGLLERYSLVTSRRKQTKGRSRTVWSAV